MNSINYPKIILIDLKRQIDDLNLHIGHQWLPIVDISALLSGLFTVFVNPEYVEGESSSFIYWVITEFIENRDLSEIQKLYIRDVLLKIIQDIKLELDSKDLLNNYFPYEFKELLSTGSVVLSKIDSG
jgi:hypothetical protein